MKNVNNVRINKLIQIRGKMSQKEFAQSIDMNPSFYCRLENGTTPISDKTMRRIAVKYKVLYQALIDDSVLEIAPSDFEVVDDISQSTRTLHERKSFEKSVHQLLDEIIEFGGKDNLQYMKTLSNFLTETHYLLEYKRQFHDLSENEDEFIDEAQKLINILLEM